MQALQRVHRSRSIGLSLSHSALNAPSQPASRVRRPFSTTCSCAWLNAPAVDEQAQLQPVGEQRGSGFGGDRVAEHQAASGRPVADRRHRLARQQLRGGDQRGDLRRGLRAVTRPAAGFADVDEVDRPLVDGGRAVGLLVQFQEQPLLLGARDQQRLVAGAAELGRALEGSGLAPAQHAVHGVQAVRARARRLRQRPAQRRRVQRHRPVAVADQGLHREGPPGRPRVDCGTGPARRTAPSGAACLRPIGSGLL